MANIRIGTCSWKYDSWRGIIYSNKKPINYLEEYARFFNTVEIDQWFWSLFGIDKIALPKAEDVENYRQSVPADFKFSIKVPNSITLTHFYRKDKNQPLQPNPYFLSVELFHQFLEAISPLGQNLGPLMFQFEYLNKQKMPSLASFLNQFRQFYEQLPKQYAYGLEIRNPNYLNRAYFQFINQINIAHVFLQGYYMPPITDIYWKFRDYINGLTIIRLHGPDRSDIEAKSQGRWNRILEPKDAELAQIARMVEDLQARGVDVYINVNNHYEGSAPLTIGRLASLLKMNLLPFEEDTNADQFPK